MLILKFLLFIAIVLGIYEFTQYFNRYSQKRGNYRFFTLEHTIAIGASYVMMFFGMSMIRSNWQNDPLNGIIVLIIGFLA